MRRRTTASMYEIKKLDTNISSCHPACRASSEMLRCSYIDKKICMPMHVYNDSLFWYRQWDDVMVSGDYLCRVIL